MSASPDNPHRLVSLDIFRGVTIAGMIVVNNLRFWSDTPRLPRLVQLVHSEWNGCTLADLIFPLFIFIVGASSVFSLDHRVKMGDSPGQLHRHVLSRTAAIFLLGLFTGSFFLIGWLLQAICPPAETQKSIWAIFFSPPPATDVFFFSLANLRIPGVLQRIALVYLAVSLLLIHTGWRVQALVAAMLLLLYWGLMSIPGFDLKPGQDLGAFIDRAVFGEAHLWRYSHTWDPEGLLGTLPAIATGLAGALTGHWLHSAWDGHRKLMGLLLFGLLGVAGGAAWGLVFPLNKPLWTSSYVLYTAGWALIFLGFWYWLADLQQEKLLWAKPFVWLGMNPLFAYCGAQVGALVLGVLYFGTPTNHTHLSTIIPAFLFGENWDVIGQSHWHNPLWPSLGWAMLYLSFWTLVSGFLYRQRIFFKV